MAVKITTDDLLGNGNSTPWWQRAAQQAVQSIKLPNTDNSLSYGELRQFQAVGNTDSPTNQMVPNIVIPGKENPALTGMAPPQGGGKAPAQGTEPQLDSYDRMLEFLQANQIADADADKRARKRELMAAIGDGISAVSSLYQTTKGAPVTYTPGADMSEAMRQRYDRMTAQRKADSDKYLNYLRVQQAREQAEENQEYRRQMAEIRREEMENRAESRRERQQLAKEKEARLKQVADDKHLGQLGKAVYPTWYDYYRSRGYSDEQADVMAKQHALEALKTEQAQNQQKVDNQTTNAKANETRAIKSGSGKSSNKNNKTNKRNTKKKPGKLGVNPNGL